MSMSLFVDRHLGLPVVLEWIRTAEKSVEHPASRAFLNSTRKKGLCRNCVNSLLNMRKALLGDSFKPRPSLDRTPRRHIDFRTEGSKI